MAGIELPIGIDTVNPVPADYKYGPYASLAAAKAAIPLVLRYDGLTVQITGSGNYWWLAADLSDVGLIPKTSGGASIIYITRVALQALIAGSTLQEGAYYAITDFLDKEITDVNSVVIVTATSTNTISQTGFWKRLTQNKAYGAFTLDTGVAGSVDQITVGGVTLLMTASVPYTTSRINTANLVAANVNANSGVSGYTAIVIAGETVIDKPAIVIQSTTAGVNTSSLAVSVTTLTVANLVNLTMGRIQVDQILNIAYDITADRIIKCYDPQYGITMNYTTSQIATLTYNPIVNWRWGHNTFINWTINGTGYRNFFDFPSTSGANTIEQNNNLNGGLFQNVVIRRISAINTAIINNVNTLNFSNVQLLSNGVLSNNSAVLNFTNVTVTGTNNQIVGNEGSYNNALRIDANRAMVTLNNTSCTGLTISNNNIQGVVSFSGVCSSTLAISNNFVDGTISNTASTYIQAVTVSSNNVSGSITIPTGTLNFIINISNNVIQNATVTTTNMNITVAGFTFTFTNNTFIRSATTYSINFSGTGNITFDEVLFEKGITMSGLVTTFSALRTTWVGSNMAMGGVGSEWNVNITDSALKDCVGITNSGGYPRTCTIVRSTLNNVTFGATPNLNITNSLISDSQLRCDANSIGVLTITESNIGNGSLIRLLDINRTANVTFTNCQLVNTTALCYGKITGSANFNFTNSVFTSVNIDTYNIGDNMVLFSVADSNFENVTIENVGTSTSPNTTDIARCKLFNCVLQQQDNSVYSLYDSEVSYSTIIANTGGTSFTFQSCVIEYNSFDFTPTPVVNYDFINLTIINNRGLYKPIFTFDGSAGFGLVGVPCNVLGMIGQDIFNAIITKASISTITGLTSVGGSINMAASGGPIYIAATPVATLNANYQLKNEPVGVINQPTAYSVQVTPTIASITAGSAEMAIEFLIAP